MTPPNEGRYPDHEEVVEKLNSEGFVDEGVGPAAAVQVTKQADSTSARIDALMAEEGLGKEEATKRAVQETEDRVEGKHETYPNLGAYLRKATRDQDPEMYIDDSMGRQPRPADMAYINHLLAKPGDCILSIADNGVFSIFYKAKDSKIRMFTLSNEDFHSIGSLAPHLREQSDLPLTAAFSKELEGLGFRLKKPDDFNSFSAREHSFDKMALTDHDGKMNGWINEKNRDDAFKLVLRKARDFFAERAGDLAEERKAAKTDAAASAFEF